MVDWSTTALDDSTRRSTRADARPHGNVVLSFDAPCPHFCLQYSAQSTDPKHWQSQWHPISNRSASATLPTPVDRIVLRGVSTADAVTHAGESRFRHPESTAV